MYPVFYAYQSLRQMLPVTVEEDEPLQEIHIQNANLWRNYWKIMTYLLHIRRDKIKEKPKNMQENIQEINIFTEYLQQVLYC